MTEEATAAEGPDTFRNRSERSLRQRAEEVVQKRPEEMQEIPAGDIQDLIHELQVHQVELEMQNEELRRAQRELERSRDRYSDLYEFAPVGYLTLNRKGTILEANLTLATLLGVARGHLIEQSLSHFIAEGDQDTYYHYRRKLFETQQPQSCELRMVRGDGSRFWVRIEARALVDRESEVVCRATLSDITERKRAEEALRESEKRFRMTIQLSPIGVGIVDSEGALIDCNAALADMLGYSCAELLRLNFADFTHPDDLEREWQLIQDLWGGKKPEYRMEKRYIHKDGHTVWVDVAASLFKDETGELDFGFAFVQDITKRKRAEEKLAQYAAELERSNRELEQFGYLISHDLQAPLRMVKSWLKLLEKRCRGELDEKVSEYIAHAVDSAERMQEMISALLDLSRVGTRGQSLAPVDIEAVLERTLRGMRSTIQESGAEVTYDPLPTVMADEAQLAQVFQNLIANGIKFRREGVAPRVHVSAEQKGDEWVFSVADNGIGIDPEQAERIFQIFQRLHTEGEYPGLGIGLALCKRIVERHGGRIWVESAVGEGSTFSFTIPVRKEIS